MGFILDAIFLAPFKLPMWVGGKIAEVAYAEMTDENALKTELLKLGMRLELGEITEEEHDRREAELLAEMERIRKLKEEGSSR